MLANRQNLYNGLKGDKTLKVPGSGYISATENDFDDYYDGNFSKFQADWFGDESRAKELYNWGKNTTWSNGKVIFTKGYDGFLQINACDLDWAKNLQACKSMATGEWDKGTRKTNSAEWLQHFPCLKKYFDEASLKPKVDDGGYTYFENKNPKNGKIYYFYSDGQIYTDNDEDTGKKWKCSTGRGKTNVIVEIYKSTSVLKEQISFDIGGGTSTGGGNTGGGNTGGGTPSGWNEHCDGTDANPYKVGCKSANIGKAQGCLGSLYKGTVDDKFGKNTLSAIQQKLGKDTFTIEDLNRKICDIKFDDSDDSSLENTSDLP